MNLSRFEELRRLYEKQMTPADARNRALADAQYEDDEREAIQNEK